MFDEPLEFATEISLQPSLGDIDETDVRPGRIIENVLIRPEGTGSVCISWTSDDETARSWIFMNGKLAVGPFMAGTKERSIVLPVPTDNTFKIEVHDYYGNGTTPNPLEESPFVKPVIAWNGVESAVCYRIYHTLFDTGSIETLLLQVPPLSMDRLEIDCPKKLEGKNGRWHSFRVETVDQFGNESENHRLAYFAADLPTPPKLSISRNTTTGLLNFRIEK
jgi:hypothetical protein